MRNVHGNYSGNIMFKLFLYFIFSYSFILFQVIFMVLANDNNPLHSI